MPHTDTAEKNTGAHFIELLEIIARLRGPDGCPWDREQTPGSIKKYLIEEAHEAAEALDSGQPSHVCDELGDLLFIILFLARMFEEKGDFSACDIVSAISAKMIRRHPHVFAAAESISRSAQQESWQAIKRTEKGDGGSTATRFSSLPDSLPALRKAQRVSEKAAATGFDWSGLPSVLAKLEEELAELREALEQKNPSGIFEEMGDVLFVLVNICRLVDINGEDAMNSATKKFVNRFTRMERTAAAENESLAGKSEETLLGWWQRAKKI